MALWTGLGQAATVAQLVGADVGGLISMIVQAAIAAHQNKSECEQLARRVLMIAQLLPHVQEPEAAQPLAGLDDTLRDAHELVVSCQGRSAAYQFIMASRTAERFREVQSKIDSYLILFPVISHIGITRRLERIYNVLVPDDSTSTTSELSLVPQPSQLQELTQVFQEVLPQGTKEFKFLEIVAATNNFALDAVIAEGSFGKVYRGRLHDGRKVAIKCFDKLRWQCQWRSQSEEEFRTELSILSRLRHKHIVRLLGWCVTLSKDKRQLTIPQKEEKGLLTRARKEPKEPEEPEGLIVYEYMENGTLFDHLHADEGSSKLSPVTVSWKMRIDVLLGVSRAIDHLHVDEGSSKLSPVTVSWKMRIDVLLGVSRAIEHLHCHADPPIIHRDVKSANILFDASWVPHLSDFGLSVACDMASEESAWDIASGQLRLEVPVAGTMGYIDPEFAHTGRVRSAIDVYGLGVLMLEVLTGKKVFSQAEEYLNMDLVSFALPIIEAGNIEEMLDRRPVPEPTPWQLRTLKRVAQIARCCVKFAGKDRPTISGIVANLEAAHELICRDEPDSVDKSGLWPFFEKVDLPPDSPRASSVLSGGYYSDPISEELEEGR